MFIYLVSVIKGYQIDKKLKFGQILAIFSIQPNLKNYKTLIVSDKIDITL